MSDSLARRWCGALAMVVAALWIASASAQSIPGLGGFGRVEAPGAAATGADATGAEQTADRERPPDLAAYGEVAESYGAGTALDFTQREIDRFRMRLLDVLARAPSIGDDLEATLSAASPTGRPSFFAGLGAFLVFLLAVGRSAAMLFAIYVARPIFVGLQRPNPRGLIEKGPVLAARVGLVIAGISITVLFAMLVGAGFYPDDVPAAVQTAIVVFTGFAALRVIDTIWRMALAPYLPDYRVPALTDREAVRLYRWSSGLFLVVVTFTWTLYWLKSLGLPQQSYALLTIVSTLVQMLVLITGASANRASISKALRGGRAPEESSWLSRGAARLWLPGLIVFLVIASAETAYRAIMGAPTGIAPPKIVAIVVTAAILVYGLLVYLIERVARPRPKRVTPAAPMTGGEPATGPTIETPYRDPKADGGDMDSGDEEGGGPAPFVGRTPPALAGMTSYEDLARRVASLFAIAAAGWALLYLWVGSIALREGSAFDMVRGVVDILFIGYVAFHAVRIWIDRRIAEEGGDELDMEPGDEGGGASAASRLATLLPLVRSFVLAMIVVSVAIFAATELGVNVAPLLGGAGVVGLAIGFGSQTLVRDILSGAFFLMDDAFRKGEYVDIGDVKGTVEKISLRSFQLRHHLGALNTIPFGEVKFLTNYSRDWVMMKLPLRLTYDTDIDKVRKLVKKLGQELLSHPEEGHKFLQPLKSQGVYMMEDSAMIVRIKFMTRPGDQWTTRKLVYQRIREIFEKEGIKFAHREVTVRIPGIDKRDLSEEERAAVGAAAQRAVEAAEEAARFRPMAVGDDR